jgi:hypothetical protein
VFQRCVSASKRDSPCLFVAFASARDQQYIRLDKWSSWLSDAAWQDDQ